MNYSWMKVAGKYQLLANGSKNFYIPTITMNDEFLKTLIKFNAALEQINADVYGISFKTQEQVENFIESFLVPRFIMKKMEDLKDA